MHLVASYNHFFFYLVFNGIKHNYSFVCQIISGQKATLTIDAEIWSFMGIVRKKKTLILYIISLFKVICQKMLQVTVWL